MPPLETTRWLCPCGELINLAFRNAHLRGGCVAYRDCWEGVLVRLVDELGKHEAERRVARLGQYKLCSTDEAFCALGESGGVVHEAVEKLRNAAYREEMRTAADACNVSQYIKTRRKRRKPKVEPEPLAEEEDKQPDEDARDF